jgi:hypothetical protein
MVTSVVVTTALPGPFPVRAIVCGDPAALSTTLRFAVTVPVAVGVKTIEIVQLDPAGSVALHVFVCEKLAAPVPASETVIPVIVAVPAFVSVAT